jgi:hypothetical protein
MYDTKSTANVAPFDARRLLDNYSYESSQESDPTSLSLDFHTFIPEKVEYGRPAKSRAFSSGKMTREQSSLPIGKSTIVHVQRIKRLDEKAPLKCQHSDMWWRMDGI